MSTMGSMVMSNSSATMTMTDMMSATSSADMTNATGMSSHTMMGMSDMTMLFFFANNTPLWWSIYTPDRNSIYACLCLLLIVMATTFKILLYTRESLPCLIDRIIASRNTGLITTEEIKEGCPCSRPWRINEAIIQASFDTVLAGLGYLLMIAVMTMNVGYFLSILGGVFLGGFMFPLFGGVYLH